MLSLVRELKIKKYVRTSLLITIIITFILQGFNRSGKNSFSKPIPTYLRMHKYCFFFTIINSENMEGTHDCL